MTVQLREQRTGPGGSFRSNRGFLHGNRPSTIIDLDSRQSTKRRGERRGGCRRAECQNATRSHVASRPLFLLTRRSRLRRRGSALAHRWGGFAGRRARTHVRLLGGSRLLDRGTASANQWNHKERHAQRLHDQRPKTHRPSQRGSNMDATVTCPAPRTPHGDRTGAVDLDDPGQPSI